MLRQQISDSTISWAGGDSEIARDCTIAYVFSGDGSLVRQTSCQNLLTPSPYFVPGDGKGGTQRAEGSWTVRDEKLCYNFFRINDHPTTAVMQEATCVDVRISGNRATIYDRPDGIAATIVKNG